MEAIEPQSRRAMVFVGGRIGAAPLPDPDAFVVGCDSGYDHARALGHHVDLLVGDLDSISTDESVIRAAGTKIERHPQRKDATDFELGIEACLARGITRIDVYGGEGGRLDHLLSIATALTNERWRATTLAWHTTASVVTPLLGHGSMTRATTPGMTVSLVPVSDVSGVTTTGLEWTLADEDLPRGTSRGVSNVATDAAVTVSIERGALLVIVGPEDLADDAPDKGTQTP